jgi:hypothetical protein
MYCLFHHALYFFLKNCKNKHKFLMKDTTRYTSGCTEMKHNLVRSEGKEKKNGGVRVLPVGLFDAAVVSNVLALGVEAVQARTHLPHLEVAVLI